MVADLIPLGDAEPNVGCTAVDEDGFSTRDGAAGFGGSITALGGSITALRVNLARRPPLAAPPAPW